MGKEWSFTKIRDWARSSWPSRDVKISKPLFLACCLTSFLFGYTLMAYGWSAIGAISTIFTGGVASVIAFRQKEQINLGVKRREAYVENLLNEGLGRRLGELSYMLNLVIAPNIERIDVISKKRFDQIMSHCCEVLIRLSGISRDISLYVDVVDQNKMTEIRRLDEALERGRFSAEQIKKFDSCFMSEFKVLIDHALKIIEQIKVVDPSLEVEVDQLKDGFERNIKRFDAGSLQIDPFLF